MKQPAAAIASAFASGIAMGGRLLANRASSRGFVFGELGASLLLIDFFFPATRKNCRSTTCFPNPLRHLYNLTF
jgi:hypothetical protein